MKFLARMVQYAATKWLGKSLQLYSTSGNLGILKAIFPEPADTLTEDEVASLKTVPGVYEAYQGLHKLSLDVLVFGLSLFFFCFAIDSLLFVVAGHSTLLLGLFIWKSQPK